MVTTQRRPKRLGQILIEQGLITEEHLQRALEEHRNTPKSLGRVLIDLGYISERDLVRALAEGSVGKNLYLISNYRQGLNCSTGAYYISTGNNSNFLGASVMFYSPCTVTLNNQNDFTGQVFANTVTINNHFTLHATPVLVPGAGDVAGFDQSIVYLREIVN